LLRGEDSYGVVVLVKKKKKKKKEKGDMKAMSFIVGLLSFYTM
jgi:hypothetical protein